MKSIILLAFFISIVEISALEETSIFIDIPPHQEISHEEKEDILNVIQKKLSNFKEDSDLEEFTWSNGKIFFNENNSELKDSFRDLLLSNNPINDPVLLESFDNDKLEVGVVTKNTGEEFYIWIEKKDSLAGTRFQRSSFDINNPFSEGIGAGYSIKLNSNTKIGIESSYRESDNKNITGIRLKSKF